MLSKTSQGLTAPELSGFFAVPSVASASAFVGIEGTAKNGAHGLNQNNCFAGSVLAFFSTFAKLAKKRGFRVAVSVPLQLTDISVCRLSSACRLGCF